MQAQRKVLSSGAASGRAAGLPSLARAVAHPTTRRSRSPPPSPRARFALPCTTTTGPIGPARWMAWPRPSADPMSPARSHRNGDAGGAGVRASVAAAPRTGQATVGTVNDVGLKDVPLRSLYPEEPKPPAPVGKTPAPACRTQRLMGHAVVQTRSCTQRAARSTCCSIPSPRRPAHVAEAAHAPQCHRTVFHRPFLLVGVVPHAACLQGAPKLKVAIVGGGLAGLSTAVELLDQGCVSGSGVGRVGAGRAGRAAL